MFLARLIRRWPAVLAAGFALALAGVSPASAASSAANPLGCSPTQDLGVPLGSFGDANLYATAPGGTFEDGTTAGWLFFGGAQIVDGNEPFSVLGASDGQALRLAGNASAISAIMCVDETFPNFRFFARNLAPGRSQLEVEVVFMDTKGRIKSEDSGVLTTSGSDWQLVTPFKIGVSIDRTATNAAAPIAFRFTAKGGDWRIDDLVVDPYRRS